MATLRLLMVAFVISQCSVVVKGSHFRGGVITWTPSSNVTAGTLPVVNFEYRVAFRRSFSTDHFCDAQRITSGVVNPGEGNLQCDPGCSPDSDDFDYRCTDFSEDADWTTGIGEAQFTPSLPLFDVFYSGGNWISLENGGNGAWVIRSSVNLTTRPDGIINSSPTTTVMPIVRVQQNCPTSFNIPVTDPDGDTIRCRFANGNDECASICGSLDDATIDQANCRLNWTANQVGLYGVAIQIEDFLSDSSTTPLSSIPLQFLLEVFESDGDCAAAPVFAPTVLIGDSCIAVPVGGTFTTRIEAVVSDPTRSITAINTVSPVGLTSSAVQQDPGSAVTYFIDVTFAPSGQLQRQLIFCFVAEDNGGLTSEQRCIFLVTATPPPVATSATLNDNRDVLTITADQPITTPSSPRLVSIMSLSTGQVVLSIDTSTDATVSSDGMSLVVQLPSSLSSTDTFLANLARGVFETNDFCGVENEPQTIVIMADVMDMLVCPMNISLVLSNNENSGFVSWDAPIPPSGLTLVAGPSVTQGFYPRGTNTSILYIFQTSNNDYEFCKFYVEVGPDPHPCPDNIVVYALRGSGGTIVTWDEPASRDRIISAPVPSGSFLPPGVTCVSYSFNSVLGVVDSCDFEVEVVEVSPCDDEPCYNDGICIATAVDSFQCVCADGCYTGSACEDALHVCAIPLCANGGTCELVEGSCSVFYCRCPPCFTGPTCETAIDPCATGLCKSGSECVVTEGSCDSYSCECDECVFGAFCEFEVPNPCDLDPCEDGFECTQNPENCYGYICFSPEPDPSCVSGGIEIPVENECLNSPCQNFGVCIQTRSWNEDGFTCLCTEGYGGYLCDVEIDENPEIQGCSNTTCLNNATCINSYTSYQQDAPCEYTCICEEGYSGPDCFQPAGEYSPCAMQENEPCLNGGVCRNIFISPRNDVNFICDCPVGYGGPRCEVEMTDICESAPCMNGGTCSRRGTFFQCDCTERYMGNTCEVVNATAIPPLILGCPTPIIITSDVPVSVPWTMPAVLELANNLPVRLVSANALPGAVYNPGHFQEVELVFEVINGLQASCEFWIYINPITLPVAV